MAPYTGWLHVLFSLSASRFLRDQRDVGDRAVLKSIFGERVSNRVSVDLKLLEKNIDQMQ